MARAADVWASGEQAIYSADDVTSQFACYGSHTAGHDHLRDTLVTQLGRTQPTHANAVNG
jgi:hypothetical protein